MVGARQYPNSILIAQTMHWINDVVNVAVQSRLSFNTLFPGGRDYGPLVTSSRVRIFENSAGQIAPGIQEIRGLGTEEASTR
jgi:hypothetical protein